MLTEQFHSSYSSSVLQDIQIVSEEKGDFYVKSIKNLIRYSHEENINKDEILQTRYEM